MIYAHLVPTPPPTPPQPSALAVLFKRVVAWVRRQWREPQPQPATPASITVPAPTARAETGAAGTKDGK
jgi:hypothetical protein